MPLLLQQLGIQKCITYGVGFIRIILLYETLPLLIFSVTTIPTVRITHTDCINYLNASKSTVIMLQILFYHHPLSLKTHGMKLNIIIPRNKSNIIYKATESNKARIAKTKLFKVMTIYSVLQISTLDYCNNKGTQKIKSIKREIFDTCNRRG